MQTSREVIDRLFRNRPPFDRVGLYDSPWGDTLEQWLGHQGYPANAEKKPVDPVDHFGFDLAGVGGWFDLMPLRGFSEVVQETDEWKSTRNGVDQCWGKQWWPFYHKTFEHGKKMFVWLDSADTLKKFKKEFKGNFKSFLISMGGKTKKEAEELLKIAEM